MFDARGYHGSMKRRICYTIVLIRYLPTLSSASVLHPAYVLMSFSWFWLLHRSLVLASAATRCDRAIVQSIPAFDVPDVINIRLIRYEKLGSAE